jgi:hypothetical protein
LLFTLLAIFLNRARRGTILIATDRFSSSMRGLSDASSRLRFSCLGACVIRIGHAALPVFHGWASAIERMHALRELCVIQFRNVGECRQIAEPVARNADPERPAAEIEVRDAPGDRDEPIAVIDDGILDATAVVEDAITDRSKARTVLERCRYADDRAAREILAVLSRVTSPIAIRAPIAVWYHSLISPDTGAQWSNLHSEASRAHLDTDLTERMHGRKHQASSQTQTDVSSTE